MMKPPFFMEGITTTHTERSIRSRGMPWSGASVISRKARVARVRRSCSEFAAARAGKLELQSPAAIPTSTAKIEGQSRDGFLGLVKLTRFLPAATPRCRSGLCDDASHLQSLAVYYGEPGKVTGP